MTKFVTVVGNFLGVLVMVKFLGVLVILLMSATAHAGDIKGIPRVVDGDTLVISKERIRLHGIDSPETRQTCTKDGKVWSCGRDATAALATRIGAQSVTCKGDKRDRYKRLIGVCYLEGKDLNAWMVRQGWALAYRKYSTDYVDDELAARDNRRGIWEGTFIPPWDWRRRPR
jgi:endonuclease YncB( thermonuclease family)